VRTRLFFALAVACVIYSAFATPVGADVRLPGIIQSHMVLQRDVSVPIWGWAEPEEEVTVAIAGQAKNAAAGPDGRWIVRLDPLAAGGPHTMTVSGTNTIALEDILVGEVWLCSGQSNMAMAVGGARDAEQEIAAASFPQIRMATVARQAAAEPQEDCQVPAWQVCSPATVKGFSATAYFFGRYLHQHLNVPIGLINSSWGGTCIEAWTSTEALAQLESGRALIDKWQQMAAQYDPEAAQQAYEKRLADWEEKVKETPAGERRPRKPVPPVHPSQNQNAPGTLYNGMIAPLVPFAIRGAAWYQGERNSNSVTDAYEYREELPVLIGNWRATWDQGEFPFLFVQLPNFAGKQPEALALNRESMLLSLSTPNTGMAITIDIGETNNIHPKNKQDVGERLGLAARHLAYGEEVVWSGPIYGSMQVEDNRAIVTFDHVGTGLVARDGELREFAVAGEDRQFVPARAEIKGDTVVVWSEQIVEPVAVRYGWTSDPQCNLYNREGLPASPFRTDDWPIAAVEQKAE
jgi:sialate O-acetylesterase